MTVLMLTNMFSDFEICLSCSGSRATFWKQDICEIPGNLLAAFWDQNKTSRSRHHNKYLLCFRDLFVLFWDQNKTSRSRNHHTFFVCDCEICLSCSGTRTRQEYPGIRETNSCDFEICLSCSETRTRQADPGQSDCIVLGPEQDNQIPEPQKIVL